VIIATLIIVQLYTTEKIQLRNYEDIPLAAPPQRRPHLTSGGATRGSARDIQAAESYYTLGKITAPTSIPKTVSLGNAAPAPDLGGLEGGVPGGRTRGTTRWFTRRSSWWDWDRRTAASARLAARRIVRVGSNLKAPQQTYSVQPDYPTLAKQERISGACSSQRGDR